MTDEPWKHRGVACRHVHRWMAGFHVFPETASVTTGSMTAATTHLFAQQGLAEVVSRRSVQREVPPPSGELGSRLGVELLRQSTDGGELTRRDAATRSRDSRTVSAAKGWR
jgi:hypothetical protein